MALNFPSSPTVGPPATEYGRWVWNGNAWVPKPTTTAPMLPIGGGVITGNLGVQGTTSLTGTLTAAGQTNLNTLAVNGQANFADGMEVDGVDFADLATQQYVDEAVTAGGLWRGSWLASSNVPDLTDPDLHQNGWSWTIMVPDPTEPFDIPATPAIPGLSGQTVYNGDKIEWSATQSAFLYIQGSSISLQEAQGMFLPFSGGTLTGSLTLDADPIGNLEAATKQYVDLRAPTIAAPIVLQQPGAGGQKTFTMALDFTDPSVAFYQLQSTDLISMNFMLVFDLLNLAPGRRKQVVVQTSQLYRPYMTPAWNAGGTGNMPESMAYWSAVGIMENGAVNRDWDGRDNVGMTQTWMRRSGDIGGMTEGMRYWRQRIAQASPPATAVNLKTTITGAGVWSSGIGEWWNRWFMTSNRMLYSGQEGSVRQMSYLRATFDYYSPTMKFITAETYYPRHGIGT